eukprot:RCo039443
MRVGVTVGFLFGAEVVYPLTLSLLQFLLSRQKASSFTSHLLFLSRAQRSLSRSLSLPFELSSVSFLEAQWVSACVMITNGSVRFPPFLPPPTRPLYTLRHPSQPLC